MTHFVGLDVSVEETAVCVVDEAGEVICEHKVPTEPDDIAVLLTSVGGDYVRVGIEAGPLSQWLVNGLIEAGLPLQQQRCKGGLINALLPRDLLRQNDVLTGTTGGVSSQCPQILLHLQQGRPKD